MKYPEYDSPFELTISDITTKTARNIDEMCWQAVQRVGINVDKEKLLIALRQDAERYREAYAKGYDTGCEKRDDNIVRCKDCKYFNNHPMEHGLHYGECDNGIGMVNCDWFCADGERKQ